MSKQNDSKIEDNKLLKAILLTLLDDKPTDRKVKILSEVGMKSEEIGSIVGMSGRGIRKNKQYREKNEK